MQLEFECTPEQTRITKDKESEPAADSPEKKNAEKPSPPAWGNRQKGETDHIIIGIPVNLMGGSIKFRVFDCRFFTVRRGRHDRYSGPPGSVHPDTQAAVVVLPNYVLGHVRAGGDGVRRVTNPIVFRLVREQTVLRQVPQPGQEISSNFEHLRCDYRRTSDHFLSCDTRKAAGWLSGKMSQDGHSVAVLSGDLTVEQRLAVSDRFQAGL
ncbi:DEAD-box helicase Dbp80-like [Topomyia yanbarensis]|uniref:DEAD-box helicase Dbp80-like n=1 Tax=Topomyia yanbarensis TaxID=2498891 RepID=UPI00273B58E0|nr:DEAD-box helicase Dbp80-like [Topomyia yanbarensis]